MAEDSSKDPPCRDGRRRDDTGHLGDDQGAADPPLSRYRPQILRPGLKEAGRDGRRGHHGRGERRQGIRRGREMRHHHAGRCAGPEYGLKKAWPSPNGTIRSALDGTVFRKPIMVKNISPAVRNWKKPIIIGRHAYGDIYAGVEMNIDRPGKVELVYTTRTGRRAACSCTTSKTRRGHGHPQLGEVDPLFRRSCITYAIDERVDALVLDERHDQQEVSRLFQGDLRPGSGSAESRPRQGRRRLPLSAHRRRGGANDEAGRGNPLGGQQL